jgi:Flp pilus assembly protein TadG
VVVVLIFSTIVGGLGVFRYQQVAALARQGARYASVHGGQYEKEKNQPAATADDIKANIVQANATALKPSLITCTVTWNSSNDPLTTTDFDNPVGNTVTVTVTYQWFPEAYLAGPITLTSSSTAQILY